MATGSQLQQISGSRHWWRLSLDIYCFLGKKIEHLRCVTEVILCYLESDLEVVLSLLCFCLVLACLLPGARGTFRKC